MSPTNGNGCNAANAAPAKNQTRYAPDSIARAVDALYSIPADLSRDQWVKIGMAFHAAGGGPDEFDSWSAQDATYNAAACRDTFRSFKTSPGGVGAGTLFAIAKQHGWQADGQTTPAPARAASSIEAPSKPLAGMGAAEVFSRCEPATNRHGYIVSKGATGAPLESLRVVPAGDKLTIAGQSMAGYLAVPASGPDGTIQSLQFIPPAGGKKLNLRGANMAGASFTVGDIVTGGVAYIVEGIGQAWACWQATGTAAVVCFGAGNMARVARELRQRDASARLVVVPDVGKEKQAAEIAAEVQGQFVIMPEGWEQNSDVNDLAKRDGLDVLELLLSGAVEPPKSEPRYKPLGSSDLAESPSLSWRIRGVLPAMGLAGLYGPSASGKSFLALDMAAAIAEGRRWFGCRVEPAPVVFVALEGEAGFKLRAQAWETHYGRSLPDSWQLVIQPFKLTDPEDVRGLAEVVPNGAVVFIDTLSRAAPNADENSSKDMGEILEAAKLLQRIIGGLVVLIHHTGKDTNKGMRGHSSLLAALDATVEVSRKGDLRTWRVAKAKDGADGQSHSFRLQVEALGTDSYGDAVTSCTVQANGSTANVKLAKVPQGGNQGPVYEEIVDLLRKGESGKPGAPPTSLCIAIEAAVTAGAKRLTCTSDKKTSRAREAITGLVSRGVFGLNEGWLWAASDAEILRMHQK